MELAKAKIIDYFMGRGDFTRAEEADATLPDPVDLQEHADALRGLGMNPALLATQIDNLES